MATTNIVGKQITIPAGTRVTRAGVTAKRTVATRVTVLRTEATRTGKTRAYWKSHGLLASATL